MPNLYNLLQGNIMYSIGDKYGKLTIIGAAQWRMQPGGQSKRQVACQCECGNIAVVGLSQLKSGKTQSCGCKRNQPAINRRDLTGQVFGRLTVKGRAETKKGKSYWNCLCQCGNTKTVIQASLTRGLTKSCGCLHREVSTKHGYSDHRLKSVYQGMKQRCNNPNDTRFPDYGGRGITVCDEWQKDMTPFIEWMLSNGWKEGLEIDRRDNDKGYSPENCRIVTRYQNTRNTRLLSRHNSSGYRGVSFFAKSKKWRAYVNVENRQQHIGFFDDKEQAAMARDRYVKEHNLQLPLNTETQ